VILQATGDLAGAMRLHKTGGRSVQAQNDPPGCLKPGDQAVILRATGDLDGAMRLYKEQEAKICRSSTTPPGCKAAWGIRLILRDTETWRGPCST